MVLQSTKVGPFFDLPPELIPLIRIFASREIQTLAQSASESSAEPPHSANQLPPQKGHTTTVMATLDIL
jgi:hypothetical protein